MVNPYLVYHWNFTRLPYWRQFLRRHGDLLNTMFFIRVFWSKIPRNLCLKINRIKKKILILTYNLKTIFTEFIPYFLRHTKKSIFLKEKAMRPLQTLPVVHKTQSSLVCHGALFTTAMSIIPFSLLLLSLRKNTQKSSTSLFVTTNEI